MPPKTEIGVRARALADQATAAALESDWPRAVELNQKGGKGSGSNRGVLVPAAMGAILFVGAFQLRWLMRTLEVPTIPPVT